MDNTVQTPKAEKQPIQPPAIEPQVLFKWGLALLGEEKAKEYLAWLFSRIDTQARPKSPTLDS
jgi:hypothetical protein